MFDAAFIDHHMLALGQSFFRRGDQAIQHGKRHCNKNPDKHFDTPSFGNTAVCLVFQRPDGIAKRLDLY